MPPIPLPPELVAATVCGPRTVEGPNFKVTRSTTTRAEMKCENDARVGVTVMDGTAVLFVESDDGVRCVPLKGRELVHLRNMLSVILADT